MTRAEHSFVGVLTPAGPLRAGSGRHEPLCAGDDVLVSVADPAAPVVAEVLPRRSALVRHAAGNRTEPVPARAADPWPEPDLAADLHAAGQWE